MKNPRAETPPAGGGAASSPRGAKSRLRRLLGERGLQRAIFYLPLVFMVLFLVVPMALTVVWSVFPRTAFWMQPGFTLVAMRSGWA